MSDPVKDQIAQEKFGKNFDELDSMQRIQVGGTKGGNARKEQMADEHGGDVHAAYAEMGSKGGESRKDQMAEEHGGDASAGYSEMGQKGVKHEQYTHAIDQGILAFTLVITSAQ